MKSNKDKNNKNEKIKPNFIVIAMAVLFIVIGLSLVFLVPAYITLRQICYLLAIFILAVGVFYIIRYFVKESYKNLQEYGFSIGVILVIIGLLAIIRVPILTNYFIFSLGVFMLFASVFKLQTAMDLNALHDKSFVFWLCVAILFSGTAIAIIMNPFSSPESHMEFTQYFMIADGIISLAESLYLYYRIRSVNKKEEESDTIETSRKSE